MQKLVTVSLDETTYGTPNAWGGHGDKHSHVEEHLHDYLTDPQVRDELTTPQ